jgi:hypothetical protein
VSVSNGEHERKPPKALSVKAENIPLELRRKPQWVVWRYERRDGKWTKPPFSVHTGHKASSTDPTTWVSFTAALKAYKSGSWNGVGFVPLPEDELVVVDQDNNTDLKLVTELNTYAERSPSGRGLHIVAHGCKPDRECSKNGPLEMYDGLTKDGKAGGKYLTFTGARLKEARHTIHNRQDAITSIYERLLKPSSNGKAHTEKPAPPANDEPQPAVTDDEADELIEKAKKAKNGDKFSKLWAGDWRGVVTKDQSQSAADLALCSMLAFWFAKDKAAMDRQFRRSDLMRDKWNRDDYRNDTLDKAIEGCGEVYEASRIKSDDKKKSQATRLVGYAREALELFHTADEEFASTLEPPRQTWMLGSKVSKSWLSRLFYLLEKDSPSGDAISTALTTLKGIARNDGRKRETFTRLAARRGRLFIDLGDDGWRAVKISPRGWALIDMPPVRFRRSRGMMPLPEPVRGGALEELRRFFNVRDEDWPLVIGWLLGTFRTMRPYPVLCLNGEHGATKSTASRILRALLDPNKVDLRAEPRDRDDLIIGAVHNWVLAFDNMSHIQPWLSDCICRLATGGGISHRALYTDGDEVLFYAERPVILNGISELPTSSDLIDRAVFVTLPAIDDKDRIPEEKFWRRFEEAKPRILGALLDIVSAGLKNLPSVKLKNLPRMADFARWVVACEPALGWKPNTFIDAYRANRRSGNSLALESSPIVRHLLDFFKDKRKWEGTSLDLLLKLNEQVGNTADRELQSWPKTPRGLSGILRRLAPNLRREDIEIEFSDNPGRGRGRAITITKKGKGRHRSHRSHRSQHAILVEKTHDE